MLEDFDRSSIENQIPYKKFPHDNLLLMQTIKGKRKQTFYLSCLGKYSMKDFVFY